MVGQMLKWSGQDSRAGQMLNLQYCPSGKVVRTLSLRCSPAAKAARRRSLRHLVGMVDQKLNHPCCRAVMVGQRLNLPHYPFAMAVQRPSHPCCQVEMADQNLNPPFVLTPKAGQRRLSSKGPRMRRTWRPLRRDSGLRRAQSRRGWKKSHPKCCPPRTHRCCRPGASSVRICLSDSGACSRPRT